MLALYHHADYMSIEMISTLTLLGDEPSGDAWLLVSNKPYQNRPAHVQSISCIIYLLFCCLLFSCYSLIFMILLKYNEIVAQMTPLTDQYNTMSQ